MKRIPYINTCAATFSLPSTCPLGTKKPGHQTRPHAITGRATTDIGLVLPAFTVASEAPFPPPPSEGLFCLISGVRIPRLGIYGMSLLPFSPPRVGFQLSGQPAEAWFEPPKLRLQCWHRKRMTCLGNEPPTLQSQLHEQVRSILFPISD